MRWRSRGRGCGPATAGVQDAELAAARAEIARLGGDRQGAGDRAGGVAGKIALGLVGPVPARVEARGQAARCSSCWSLRRPAAGWSFGRSCRRARALSERRARYWQQRARRPALLDDQPAGRRWRCTRCGPEEITAILALAEEWGEIDGSHRKLAHRGSYLARVWVSAGERAQGAARAWPQAALPAGAREDSSSGRGRSGSSIGPTRSGAMTSPSSRRAGTSALAILDLVSRKWIDTMLCPEATHVQVQALFTQGARARGPARPRSSRSSTSSPPGADASELEPVLLSVSDNGAQMTSGSTREFMALHAIATHYGRPGTPTDQAHIESLFGHVKHEWPHLAAPRRPGRPGTRTRGRARALQRRAPARRDRLRHPQRRARRPRSQRSARPAAESGSRAPASSASTTTAPPTRG